MNQRAKQPIFRSLCTPKGHQWIFCASLCPHWQSFGRYRRNDRFGEGRKLERTRTGNSAHYVLQATGRRSCAPGLYSSAGVPASGYGTCDFPVGLRDCPATTTGQAARISFSPVVMNLVRRWDTDIQQLGEMRTERFSTRLVSSLAECALAGHRFLLTSAETVKAAAQAVVKRGRATVMRFAHLVCTWMERGMDDELWKAMRTSREMFALDESRLW